MKNTFKHGLKKIYSQHLTNFVQQYHGDIFELQQQKAHSGVTEQSTVALDVLFLLIHRNCLHCLFFIYYCMEGICQRQDLGKAGKKQLTLRSHNQHVHQCLIWQAVIKSLPNEQILKPMIQYFLIIFNLCYIFF